MADEKPPETVTEPVGYSSADLMTEIPRQVFNGETIETREPEREEEVPPEEKEKPETPPDPATGVKPPEEEIPEGWEFKPKYKDHKEAERGAKEHQALATKATQETAREREAREATERERDELKQKLAEKEAAPPEKKPEEVKPAKVRISQALKTIRDLDEDDPEYDDKVAGAWADAGIGTADPKEIAKEAAKIAREDLERDAAKEPEKPKAKAESEAEANERVWKEATGMAAKAGLDMADGAEEFDWFSVISRRVPQELRDQPLQEQVDWVVGEIRKRTGKAVQTPEERERARQVQVNNSILDKGVTRPPAKKTDNQEPYTSASILREVQEDRRIRG